STWSRPCRCCTSNQESEPDADDQCWNRISLNQRSQVVSDAFQTFSFQVVASVAERLSDGRRRLTQSTFVRCVLSDGFARRPQPAAECRSGVFCFTIEI